MMSLRSRPIWFFLLLFLAGLACTLASGLKFGPTVRADPLDKPQMFIAPRVGEAPAATTTPSPEAMSMPAGAGDGPLIFLPLVAGLPVWDSPFGVEPITPMITGSVYFTRTLELHAGWVRLGNRINWRDLQPNEGDPILWERLATFENELRALKAKGISPVVVVQYFPQWATDNTVREDGTPTACGRIRTDKFPAFADFMRQIVSRYMQPEFNVHDWELGNEPDVDPDMVPPDNGFGCWGDDMDPYYGGTTYGEMLKVVAPAIKLADARARVWVGGLLLNRPDSTPTPNCGLPDCGRPELFLKGILEAGAAPYFDILPYHSYPPYQNQKIDHDNGLNSPWNAWGGGYLGKARFLKQIMGAYAVNKPLYINETGLMCPEYYPWCQPSPGDDFFQMQADFIVRSFVRALQENIGGFYWYTLEGPGWRYTGLLNQTNPQPAYIAYRHLAERLQQMKMIGPVNYGTEVEAYAFNKTGTVVHVLWARNDQTVSVSIGADRFIAAYDRDGGVIQPIQAGSTLQFAVGFSPIYLLFTP